ncbi:MAG: hypothetical protein ACREN6_16435 [Gemmatimonadaceae bacterium]
MRGRIAWPALVAVALAIGLGVFAMNPLPIGAFHDDARYLLLARSVADGTGYRFMLLPGSPAGTHFPPAFPLVLAALWKVAPAFPASVTLFKLMNAFMLGLAGFASFRFARDRGGLGPWAAAGVALAFAGSVPVLFLDGVLFSEPLFTAALLAALMLAERAVGGAGLPAGADEQSAPRDDDLRAAVMAFCAGLAIGGVTMIRTVGIALAAGLAIVLLARRRWRELACAMAGVGVFVVPWQLWTMRHGGEIPAVLAGDYGTYGNWVAAALHSEGAGFIARVAAANLKGFSILLSVFGATGAMQFAAAVPLLAVLAVGTRRLARRSPVSVASTAVYLLVVLLWPGTPDRFLWPVWPILLTGLACGAAGIVQWDTRRANVRIARGALLASLVMCALSFVRFNAGMYGSREWENPARANSALGIAASEAAARLPDGLVATEFDGLVSLYTGRRAVPLLPLMAANYLRPRTPAEAAAQLGEILDAYHPSFLLVGTPEALDAARRLSHTDPPRLQFSGVPSPGILLYVPTTR